MGDLRELTTGKFTATLKDENGTTITSGITTLEMSLYDQDGEVINEVENLNILNTGRGSLTSGVLTITFEPEDNEIESSAVSQSWVTHTLKIYYEWDGGNKQAYDETEFSVKNLRYAPTVVP